MRREAAANKARDTRDAIEAAKRERAYELIEEGTLSMRAIARATEVSRGTVSRLKCAYDNRENDYAPVRALLNPKENRAGRRSVLSALEQNKLSQKMVQGSQRGFAYSLDDARQVMGKIASDGRKNSFKNAIPSAATVRKFRCDHRELTVRTGRNKDLSKLKAQTYAHVKTFQEALLRVIKSYPCVAQNPDFLWNCDEVGICCERGRKVRVFTSATAQCSNRTGSSDSGTGPHITMVMAISASGRKAPPFLIVKGKNIMSAWFAPIPLHPSKASEGIQRFCRPGWMPQDACIVTSENGSMTKDIMPLFMQHLHKAAESGGSKRRENERRLLVLDGHGSRNGIDWLDFATDKGWEVVKSPANTSHFLQACDDRVNLRVQDGVKALRDSLLECIHMTTKSIPFKLMAAVAGHSSVSSIDIHDSWDTTGLWPMDFRFMDFYPETESEKTARVAGENEKESQRKSDVSVYMEMRKTLGMSDFDLFGEPTAEAALEGIEKLTALIQANETTTTILNERETRFQNMSEDAKKRKKEARAKSYVLSCGSSPSGAGAPAVYLTHAQSMATLAKMINDRDEEEAKKASAKKETARRRSEKEATKALEKREKEEEKVKRAAERARKLEEKILQDKQRREVREAERLANAKKRAEARKERCALRQTADALSLKRSACASSMPGGSAAKRVRFSDTEHHLCERSSREEPAASAGVQADTDDGPN